MPYARNHDLSHLASPRSGADGILHSYRELNKTPFPMPNKENNRFGT